MQRAGATENLRDEQDLHPSSQPLAFPSQEDEPKGGLARVLQAFQSFQEFNVDALKSIADAKAAEPALTCASLPIAPHVLDAINDGIVLIASNDRVAGINHSACALLSLNNKMARAALIASPVSELFRYIDAANEDPNESILRAFLSGPETRRNGMSFGLTNADGEAVSCELHSLGQGNWLLTLRDQQLSSSEARKLKIAEQEYRSLFENAVIGVYRSSLDGRQLRANPALVRLNGYETERELLRAVNDIASEWYVDPSRRETFKKMLDDQGKITDFVSEVYRHKTRERIWISENAWVVYDTTGKPLFYEGTVVDASDRMAAEEEINHLAHHDHLTGLPNRFTLLKRLREAILQPDMAASVAVHCLDLDHFKAVNDTLGHQAGDRLLIAVGKRLRSSIKSTDTLARLGGDEFTILQTGVRSRKDMEALARRVVKTLNEPFLIGEQEVSVGVSVGVASFQGQEPGELLRDADVALYEAKNAGRRTYAFYTRKMGEALRERQALEDDLRVAIEKGDFELYLQPIVDADTIETSTYEALLRWNHPTRGAVSPARFVSIAEESSLMLALGDWVLTKTVEAASQLSKGQSVAMNLSPLQLRDKNFAERVQSCLSEFGVTADKLELEITETVIMADDEVTLTTLRSLRDLGLKLALDDFGTGHASLSYLQRFRFDKIKIDQSFVKRITDDPISAAVVRAVTTLASDLGACVVAEGVETQEQVDALKREGCAFFQGFFFGHPKPWQDALND
ncbi:MAG: EAL domain-containing protein [Pseudomonadota bacterium]